MRNNNIENMQYLVNSLFRAKKSEIWNSGIVVTCIWGIFDLLVFNVIFRLFGALVSKWPVTRKQLVVDQNGVKIGT